MSEHGYSVFAEYWGEIPPDSVEDVMDNVLSRLERVAAGPVVSANPGGLSVSANPGGLSVRFSLVYEQPHELAWVAAQGKAIADRIMAGLDLQLALEALSVESDAHQERELATPNFPELVGLGEIAEIIGVSKQRVSQLREHPDFPKPVAALRAGDVWTRVSLNHFLESWPRQGGRRRTWRTDLDEKTLAAARDVLSERELEVLTRVASGEELGAVASALGISSDTVRWHMRQIFDKLGERAVVAVAD